MKFVTLWNLMNIIMMCKHSVRQASQPQYLTLTWGNSFLLGCPVCWKRFSSTLGLYLLSFGGVLLPPVVCRHCQCPLGCKIAFQKPSGKNLCSKETMYHLLNLCSISLRTDITQGERWKKEQTYVYILTLHLLSHRS